MKANSRLGSRPRTIGPAISIHDIRHTCDLDWLALHTHYTFSTRNFNGINVVDPLNIRDTSSDTRHAKHLSDRCLNHWLGVDRLNNELGNPRSEEKSEAVEYCG